MSRKPTPLFLQRASYRQRRLRDAAKLMPVAGIVLWALPIAWSSETAEGQANSDGLVYVFTVWLLLIGFTAFFASRMRADPLDDPQDGSQR